MEQTGLDAAGPNLLNLCHFLPAAVTSRVAAGVQGYRTGRGSGSGSGMNSLSPGTLSKRAAFQSAFACSMRSGRDDTKFHYDPGPVHRLAPEHHEAGVRAGANCDAVGR